jgi:hypothetical protein
MSEEMSREDVLTSIATKQWYEQNWKRGRHLEQYDQDELERLLFSRARRMAAHGEVRPINPETLNELFDDVVQGGVLAARFPADTAEEERRVAEEAAENAETDARIAMQIFIARLERTGGQTAVSEWYHNKASKEQKRRFDELFPSGAVTPEAPAAPSGSLFVIKATDRVGRVRYVSGNVYPVPLDATAAHRFGSTSSQTFAEALRKQRPELKIEIVPV